jgi:transposase
VIEPFMPQSQLGAHRKDDRQVISGNVHVLRSGCRWRDWPAEYGPVTTICNRVNRWSRCGFWRAMLAAPAEEGWTAETASLDSTYVGARRSAHGSKGGQDASVDTLGHLLALHVTPANADERSSVAILAEAIQDPTGESVDLANVTKAITASDPPRPLPATVSASRSSDCPRPSVASCSYPDDGWSNDASPGSLTITSDCPRPSQACISSPSSCCCFGAPQTSPPVRNTLWPSALLPNV